jgi:hypothetical protein
MLFLDNLDNRGRTFLIVCGLTLLPVACAIPPLHFLYDTGSFAHPRSTGWLLGLLTLFSIFCEFRALLAIENKLSGKRDIFWFLRIPVGLVSACILVVSFHACLFIALPGLVFGDIPALLAKLRGL